MVLDLLKQANKVAVGTGFELVKEGLYLIVGRFSGRSREGVALIHAFDASNKQHFQRVARRIIGGRGRGFKVWPRAGLEWKDARRCEQ